MRFRSWRGSTSLTPSTRRAFPWARVLLLLAFIAGIAYVFLPGYFFVSADALVKGNLVPVTPLYTVRIDRLLVQCNDRVTAGQNLAMVSNFLVQADYQRQYLQSDSQLQLSKIALYQQVAAAREAASVLQDKYRSSDLTAQQFGATFKSYDEAYRADAIPRVDWAAKKTEWQSAVYLAKSDYDAWHRALQEVQRVSQSQNSKIASDQQLSSVAHSLTTRVGSEPMPAPVSGYVVDCVGRPQDVVQPSNPIFTIFEPKRAYVLAYFNSNSASQLRINQPVEITIAGLTNKLDGRIGSTYPNLSKLPEQLTRFFWQHEQWSQYRPVKILLDRLSPQDRDALYYDAQARVRVRIREDWRRPSVQIAGKKIK